MPQKEPDPNRAQKSLTAYLAGPYNNCNKKQQTEWRKQIKPLLQDLGHKCIDPATHTSDWTPLKEMVDIEGSDLVIANLWRESIGTVVGILQATRSGKPVILVDPNYIESHVLQDIVGKDNVVHTIAAAVRKLKIEIAPQLQIDVKVAKRGNRFETFKPSKLQRSLNLVCSQAGISDTLLPVLVSHRVRSRLKQVAPTGVIKASQIAYLVLEELEKLVTQPDRRYSENLNKHARQVSEQWKKFPSKKDADRVLDLLAKQEAERQKEMDRLTKENRFLRSRLPEMPDPPRCFKNVSGAVQAAAARFQTFLVFHKNAQASAIDSPFDRPDEVYDALDQLAQFVEMRREKRIGLREWLREHKSSIEYAPHESETIESNGKDENQRTVIYDGEKCVLTKHLKLGGGNDNHRCRIHFEFLGKGSDLQILIGHVGRHL